MEPPGGYHPETEAISPTLPTESHDSKSDIVHSINEVDREIGLIENQIQQLQKKQVGPLKIHLNLWIFNSSICRSPFRHSKKPQRLWLMSKHPNSFTRSFLVDSVSADTLCLPYNGPLAFNCGRSMSGLNPYNHQLQMTSDWLTITLKEI